MKKKFYKVDRSNNRERAILVGIVLPGMTKYQEKDSLEELVSLVKTAGAEVVDILLQDRKKINPSTLIGRGFVKRIAGEVIEKNVKLVIFDTDLTPVQMRNLEKEINRKIVDRSGIILDIFACRAKTHEAQIQVELAQLEYFLPRLTRLWTHLSRQEAAIGTRGPGETQLEVDRRAIRKRIIYLKKSLKKIEIQRIIRRKRRNNMKQVALVGYTNVGKSSLLNVINDDDLFVEDRLFATLDSAVRGIKLPNNEKILLIDTVGFIRKLPHHLIASFRSTLKAAGEADILIHVVDISNHQFENQMATVNSILDDLAISGKPVIIVFNKIDRLEDRRIFSKLKSKYPNAVFTSALKGIGITFLKSEIEKIINKEEIEDEIIIPVNQTKAISYLHRIARVTETNYDNGSAIIKVKATKADINRIHALIKKINLRES